jgi:fructokinase
MKRPIVIGIGELLWDVLPTGKKAGGAPVNFAYHASQNGMDGYAISAIGDDELGRELMSEIDNHGICSYIETVSYPTGTVDVELRNGIPAYTIHENVAWDHIPLTERALQLASKADAICFGTLAQRIEESRRTTRAILKAAPEHAWKLYDVNLRQSYFSKELIEESLILSNAFKMNNDELDVIRNMFLLSTDDETACHQLMIMFDIKLVILTAGEAFSSVYSRGSNSTILTPKVDVVDTVGAGDAFSGALISSLIRGDELSLSHTFAVETAAHVCKFAGAWTPPNNRNHNE